MGQVVRRLTEDELPLLLPMAPEFLREFEGWRTTIEADHFLGNLRQLYRSGSGVVFGLWDGEELIGGIVGVLWPDLYDAVPTLSEVGWFVRLSERSHRHGAQLLAALRSWGREKGARRICARRIVTREMAQALPTMPGTFRAVHVEYIETLEG